MTLMPFAPVSTLPSVVGAIQPAGWNNRWRADKASVPSGGTARAVVVGESWVAGQFTGSGGAGGGDCLKFGWTGVLDTILAQQLGSYAEGYTVAGVANFTPGGLTQPTSPYSSVATSSYTVADGGWGQAWAPTVTGSTWMTISAPPHAVTGAVATSMDVFTIDFTSAASWTGTPDVGSPQTITPAAGSPPTGVNIAVIGQGIVRRTTFNFTGGGTHSVALQANGANGLALMGHVTYYATSGLGFMRCPVPGWKVTDFATGGGPTASSTNSTSLTPDHIGIWSGVGPAQPASPPGMAGSAVNLNIYASSNPGGFPHNASLAILSMLGNDCTQGGSVDAARRGLTRYINAFRRASPLTATQAACSILIVSEAYASPSSDNASVASPNNSVWQNYKSMAYDLAGMYGCAYLDLQQVFGEQPVISGFMGINGAHPTMNGGSYNGASGHGTIGLAVASLLT